MRLERLERRGVAREDAERRMAQQATDDERRAVATWVVDNSGSVGDLESQIDAIWHELEAMVDGGNEGSTDGHARQIDGSD
jgi:dephospho-CoA kinase